MPYQAARCHVIGLGSDASGSWVSVVTVAVLTVGSSSSPAVHRQDALSRPERRGSWTGEADEADDPAALASERLQQFEHPGVGGTRLTGQRPGDDVGKVVVADRDRVRIAERRPEHRPDRPRPHATDQRQPGRRDVGAGRCPFPQTMRVRRHLGERPGPLRLDAERMEPPRRAPKRGCRERVAGAAGRTGLAPVRRARGTTVATGDALRRW